MKPYLPLLSSMLVVLAGCGAGTKVITSATPYGEEGLHVSGTATVRAEPDYAVVTLGCRTSALGARNARESNKAVMSRIIAAVKAQGVEAKDVRTVQYDLTHTPVLASRGTRGRTNLWSVDNMVEIMVRDTSKIAEVIDAGTDAGANKISGVRFAVEDLHKARAEARREACRVAREKAEQLASELGGKLGRLVAVHDGGMRGWWGRDAYQAQANVAMDRAYSPTVPAGEAESEISSGQIAIQATEEVTYELR
jgi:uncharacterized protein YggE